MKTMRLIPIVLAIFTSFEMLQPVASFLQPWSTSGGPHREHHLSRIQLWSVFNENQNDDDDESNGSLPTWLMYHLYTWDLQVANFADTGRGLRTLRPRKSGDPIIAVPHERAVTLQSLQTNYADIFRPLAGLLKEEPAMAMGLLLLRNDKDPYAASLPAEQSLVFSRHMPLDLLECLPAAYRRLVSCYRLYVEQLHCDMLQQLKEAGTPRNVVALVESLDDFEWAFSTIRSRTVGVPAEDIPGSPTVIDSDNNNNNHHPSNNPAADTTVRVLLPGFDLLNHRFGARVSHDVKDGSFVVTSQDEYETGDQVFISYVSSNVRRDNLNMLLTYGFCPQENPERVLFVDAQNLLVACAQARPKYFTGPVLLQLHNLFSKVNKLRDLYAFDGATQEPRHCLQTAIRMMLELERQFLTDPDDPDFSRDVFQALLDQREYEIQQGMKRADEWKTKAAAATVAGCQEQQQQHERWNPMCQSIQTLLSLEQEYLSKRSFRKNQS